MGYAEIAAMYEAYIAEAERLERERKPFAGALGFGKKPSDDPCHERFLDELGAALDAYAAEAPGSAEARAVLELVFRAPQEHRQPASAYWTLIAAHGQALGLIGRLDAADAKALAAAYAKDYRRWERLPVQKQVLAALEGK